MSRRLLITGAAGFIGSNFARFLLETTDYSVTSLDRLDEAGSLERLAGLKSRYPTRLECVWHDLRAPISPWLLRGREFGAIVHMAAGSHVDRSVRDPVGFVMDNVVGTANLLEYARHQQPGVKVLYFSTDEVFGPAGPGEVFDESARFNPENPYAASKAGGEALCPAYAAQYGMPIVVTHCSNAYGPNQHPEKFVPLCIDRIQRGETIQIHARGGIVSSRLYIHVDDVSRATLTVLERGGVICDSTSGRYNIRAMAELSNLYVAQTIASQLGQPLRYELVENPPNRPKPDLRYALSDAKLRALGWEPTVDFETGLAALLGGTRVAA